MESLMTFNPQKTTPFLLTKIPNSKRKPPERHRFVEVVQLEPKPLSSVATTVFFLSMEVGMYT